MAFEWSTPWSFNWCPHSAVIPLHHFVYEYNTLDQYCRVVVIAAMIPSRAFPSRLDRCQRIKWLICHQTRMNPVLRQHGMARIAYSCLTLIESKLASDNLRWFPFNPNLVRYDDIEDEFILRWTSLLLSTPLGWLLNNLKAMVEQLLDWILLTQWILHLMMSFRGSRVQNEDHNLLNLVKNKRHWTWRC
jgi:hypothetical protein